MLGNLLKTTDIRFDEDISFATEAYDADMYVNEIDNMLLTTSVLSNSIGILEDKNSGIETFNATAKFLGINSELAYGLEDGDVENEKESFIKRIVNNFTAVIKKIIKFIKNLISKVKNLIKSKFISKKIDDLEERADKGAGVEDYSYGIENNYNYEREERIKEDLAKRMCKIYNLARAEAGIFSPDNVTGATFKDIYKLMVEVLSRVIYDRINYYGYYIDQLLKNLNPSYLHKLVNEIYKDKSSLSKLYYECTVPNITSEFDFVKAFRGTIVRDIESEISVFEDKISELLRRFDVEFDKKKINVNLIGFNTSTGTTHEGTVIGNVNAKFLLTYVFDERVVNKVTMNKENFEKAIDSLFSNFFTVVGINKKEIKYGNCKDLNNGYAGRIYRSIEKGSFKYTVDDYKSIIASIKESYTYSKKETDKIFNKMEKYVDDIDKYARDFEDVPNLLRYLHLIITGISQNIKDQYYIISRWYDYIIEELKHIPVQYNV